MPANAAHGDTSPYSSPDGTWWYDFDTNSTVAGSTLEHRAQDGSLLSSISHFPYSAFDMTFDPKGTAYIAAETLGQYSGAVLKVTPNGALSGVKSWTGSTPTSIEYDSNGHLDVVVSNLLDPNGSCGVEIIAITGTSLGALNYCSYGTSIKATPGLITEYSAPTVTFYKLSDLQHPTTVEYFEGQTEEAHIGGDGTYVALAVHNGSGIACDDTVLIHAPPKGEPSSFTDETITTLLGIDSSTTPCAPFSVAPLPTGGVVLAVQLNGVLSLIWTDTALHVISSAPLDMNSITDSSHWPIQLLVDNTGTVVVEYTVDWACPPSIYGCSEVRIASYKNGVHQFTAHETGDRDGYTNSVLESWPHESNWVGIGAIGFTIASAPYDCGQSCSTGTFPQDYEYRFVPLPVTRPSWTDPAPPLAGGIAPPVLTMVDARPTDPLLRRTFSATAPSGASAIEYGWAKSSTATAPGTTLQRCTTFSSCTLDYSSTTPSSTWYLFARSDDSTAAGGLWSAPRAIKTPAKPMLVALGDSITSGHHKDSNVTKTVCDDSVYSYAAPYYVRFEAALPQAWRGGAYVNAAHSGLSATDMLSGAKNSCGTAINSPVVTVAGLLTPKKNSWNRVVMTGGVDDTNWTDVIGTIGFHTRAGGETATRCAADMSSWTGLIGSTTLSITQNATQILHLLRSADPAVSIDWLSYYQIAGTGTGWLGNLKIIPAVCATVFGQSMTILGNAVKAGLSKAAQAGYGTANWVDINQIIGGKNADVQGFYPSDIRTCLGQLVHLAHCLSGWPHPNLAGEAAIANAIPL